ncbi:MAG: MATE family efflux transporter [Endomicrobium sp.]|jgi:O-antigen/teichoic acid export membrane protein|nr:MATE family efflux transporter [Endomicrobium sp.]
MKKIKAVLNHLKNPPRHLVVAASAWIARIITALIGIISVRTLLLYLGEERYAAYAIVYSLIGWFALCDLGIGFSLQNFISECRARNESYTRYLKSALQVICAAFIVSCAALLCFSGVIQDKLLVNYESVKNSNIILILGFIFILTAFANVVYRVYYALQKGYISNIFPALANTVSMIAIVLFNRYYPVKGNVLAALLIFSVPQLTIAAIPFIKIFRQTFAGIFNINYPDIKELITRSLKFSGFAVMAAATLGIDYIIMSQTINAASIAEYNILNKLFVLLLSIHSAVLMAAWPVFSELNVNRQFLVIKKMIVKYIIFGFFIITAGAALFYIFSDNIIKILAPNTNIAPSTVIFMLFGIYSFLIIWTSTFSVFLQSINVLKIFWIFVPIQALISITAQYFLSIKYGVHGILLGLIASFIFTTFIALPYKTYKIFKQTIINDSGKL